MDALLIVLGLFGLIPIATMSFFYGVLPIVLVGLQVLGAVEALRSGSRPVEQAPARPRRLDHAA